MTTYRHRCDYAAVEIDKHFDFYSTLRVGRSGDRRILRLWYFDSVTRLDSFSVRGSLTTIHQASTHDLLAVLSGFINSSIDCVFRLLRFTRSLLGGRRFLRQCVDTHQTNQEGR